MLDSIQHTFLMKIPHIKKLQQTAFNRLSDMDCHSFMNLFKKCTVKPYYFLVIDTNLTSDNNLSFRKNLVERI